MLTLSRVYLSGGHRRGEARMYIPKAFEVTDLSTLHEFIETHSFGTLVTVAGEQPVATRLPLILDRTCGRHGSLLGHVARANPQWRSFDDDGQALAGVRANLLIGCEAAYPRSQLNP